MNTGAGLPPRTSIAAAVRRSQKATVGRFSELVGGPGRARVILILAAVLAVDGADKATVGATGAQLESALGISNTQLGILAGVTSLVGALGAIPAGMLVDRVRRTHLLTAAMVLWSTAMIVGGLANSYVMLLLTRVALGAMVAFAGPSVASLTGDFFAARERARIYGFVLAGELVGAALGFLVAGELAAVLSWRYSFALLAIPGYGLAFLIARRLSEPARGGQSRLQAAGSAAGSAAEPRDEVQVAVAEDEGVRPHPGSLGGDPARLRVWPMVRYVLGVRTNVRLIVAGALGYFFFGGLRTFAVVFLRGHFGLGQSVATLLLGLIVIAAIVGVIAGGRIADRLVHRGVVTGRLVVAGTAYIVAAVIFVPGTLVVSVAVGVPLLALAAIALAAPNPPLDAARLDIMPSGLWGRAEGVRTVLRQIAEAFAPVAFGLVSGQLAAPHMNATAATGGFGANANAEGLKYTFLIMLAPLLLSGFIVLRARRSYPSDVATAMSADAARGSPDAA